MFSSLSAGREISDVYLAPMADEMSEDSEGEEVPGFNVNGKYIYLSVTFHNPLEPLKAVRNSSSA